MEKLLDNGNNLHYCYSTAIVVDFSVPLSVSFVSTGEVSESAKFGLQLVPEFEWPLVM